MRENTRKKREGTGTTTRPSLEPGENPSGERGGRGAWNEGMCRKSVEEEVSVEVRARGDDLSSFS